MSQILGLSDWVYIVTDASPFLAFRGDDLVVSNIKCDMSWMQKANEMRNQQGRIRLKNDSNYIDVNFSTKGIDSSVATIADSNSFKEATNISISFQQFPNVILIFCELHISVP